MDQWKKHMRLINELVDHVPKHHLMSHIVARSASLGNPWFHTTFLDESLNKELKRSLRFAHQLNFESTAFAKLGATLERRKRGRGT